MKNFFLRDTSLGNGIVLSTGVAGACFMGCLGIGQMLGFPIQGIAAGVALGIPAGVAFYNHGLVQIDIRNRAVLTWFGTLQQGAQNEIGDGWKWVLRLFDAVGIDEYSMLQQGILLEKIPAETKDETSLPLTLVLQYTPAEGELYWFGNLEEAEKAIRAEVESSAREFARGQENLDKLVEHGSELCAYVLARLRRRSLGGHDIDPWGINFQSVVLKDIEIPKNITEAAAEVAEAEKRALAAKALRETLVETAASFPGTDPNIALAAAMAVTMPDRSNPISGHVFAGLDGTAKAFGTAFGAAFAPRT